MSDLSCAAAARIAALVEQERRAAFLSGLSAVLNASFDYKETLRRIADLAVPELGDACAIHVIDRAGDVRLLAARHVDAALEADTRALAGRRPGPQARGWAHVLRSGVSDLMADTTPELTRAVAPDAENQARIGRLGFTSQISVPLLARGRILGALTVSRGPGDRRYADGDVRFTEGVANIAAIAVDNARLYEEAREREAEALASRERSAFLADITGVIASSLDYDETVRAAVRMVLPRLGDYCSVMIANDRGRLRQIAWAHVDPAREPLIRRLGETLFGEEGDVPSFAADAIRSGTTQLVASVDLDALAARTTPLAAALLRELAPCSVLSVPLHVRRRTIGAFSLGFAESRRTYLPADVELAEEVARRVALAVEHARLFAESQASNRAKDDFLATLSHELRTPLTAILGWSHMLRTGEMRAAVRRRAIESIEQNARAQARLVDDLIDVARSVAGKLELQRTACDVAQVARDACHAVEPAARAGEIRIECFAAMPVMVDGDPVRLRQVLDNLVTNAVKFSPRGGSVKVSVEPDEEEVVLRVIDTGIGIAPEFLPHVFDRFRQGDGSVTRQHRGLGLGLAIVRQLVEMHGGRVVAESDGIGRGATFTIRMPVVASDAGVAPVRLQNAAGV